MKRPEWMDELYRDLRDRKLLPVVGLLLVAIVAVPIALSATSGGSVASDAPVAEIVPADAPEAQAAVLAEDPGLRNYRQRLEELKAKNPFKQQFQTSGLAGTSVQGTTENTGSVTQSGGAPSTGVTDTSTSPSTSTGSGGTTTDSTTDVNVDETTQASEPEPKFYTWKLDVRYGVAGDVQKRDNVKVLDLLNPIGVFFGASLDGTKAFFVISSDVILASGDGQCAPSPADCQFLTLEEGDSEDLTYQPATAEGPTSYTLALDHVRVVKVKNPPEPK